MTLTQEELNAIRDEIDEALDDKLDDAMGDVRELATQVEWLRRDLEPHVKNLDRHTRLVFLLCERFLKLRETLKARRFKD